MTITFDFNHSGLVLVTIRFILKWSSSGYFSPSPLYSSLLIRPVNSSSATNARTARTIYQWPRDAFWPANIVVWSLSESIRPVRQCWRWMRASSSKPSSIPVNEHQRVVHKRCSSDAGCDYFYNLSNYTVKHCDTCTAQLCNGVKSIDAHNGPWVIILSIFSYLLA